MARCTGSLLKFIYTAIFFFQAEDGIRDKLVTGVQTVCSSDLRQLALEPYGGLLLNSWLGRDLGLAGRVAKRDGEVVLFRSDGPVLHLPQLAIHLDREVNSKRSEERRVGKECRSRWSPSY